MGAVQANARSKEQSKWRGDDNLSERSHLHLVCEVGEISALLAGSADISSFLSSIVGLVASHLRAEVCSIYLHDEDSDELVLRANQGLRPGVVGNVRLRAGEGLVGLALQGGAAICEPVASRHPAYRFVDDSAEEDFESFLAMPVRRGTEAIGVVVVQRAQSRPFLEAEVMALRASASMLASSIENARVLSSLGDRISPRPSERPRAKVRRTALPLRVNGWSVSPGVVSGPARHWRAPGRWRGVLEAPPNPALDVDALERAVVGTSQQLDVLQQQFERRLPEMEALIFTAQQLMLRDPSFLGRMKQRIGPTTDAAASVVGVAQEVSDQLRQSAHAYVREKADDVRDMADRLLDHLLDARDHDRTGYDGAVVLAQELWPTDVLRLSTENVAGLVAIRGGATGHTAILARSLGIPMMIADDAHVLTIPDGTALLLDGTAGALLSNPSEEVRVRHAPVPGGRVAQGGSESASRSSAADVAICADAGVVIRAEINLLGELEAGMAAGARGIGLYRTEYPFLARRTFPSELEQLRIYRKVCEAAPDHTVTIRTLDVGGDKTLRYWDDDSEDNPALGMRAIRFSLRHPDIFRDQLRAILRAGAGHPDLRILLPMVTAVEELSQTKEILAQCLVELEYEGHEHQRSPRLGVLVETPAALEIGVELAAQCDFFSIGSNDLAQYVLAIDRTNHRLADRLVPSHPAVLRGVARFVGDVRSFGHEVSVCGRMPTDAAAIRHLLAMGIRYFVVPPHQIDATRAHIARQIAASN